MKLLAYLDHCSSRLASWCGVFNRLAPWLLLIALSVCAAKLAFSQPSNPFPLSPNTTLLYRPTGLPQHVAHVYVRPGRAGLWESPVPGHRPVVIGPLNGGGFAAGTGLPIGNPTTTGTDILSRLYQKGCVIVTMGYTVDDPTLPGSGRYGTAFQAEDDIALMLSSLAQHLDRIPDMDLRNVGILGRSAGSSVALHYAAHNDCAFVVGYQTVATFAAYQNNVGVKHFLTPTGLPAANIGQSNPAAMHEQGALSSAYSPAGLRCPVFLMGDDPQTYFGSLAVRDYIGIFPPSNVHPDENVLAMKQALAGSPHFGESVFYTGSPDPRLDQAIYEWCCERWGFQP